MCVYYIIASPCCLPGMAKRGLVTPPLPPPHLPTCRPSLKHQRPQEEKEKKYNAFNEWYKRGVIEGKTATRFRKGACENCGSMTHKKKDCMEVGCDVIVQWWAIIRTSVLFVSAVQVLKYPISLVRTFPLFHTSRLTK